MADRVSVGDATITSMEQLLSTLEKAQTSHMEATVAMQLHMEYMEDCSRRNNIRLKGFPEATGPEDLPATISAVVGQLIGDSLPDNLEFDWIHRAPCPRSADPERLRGDIPLSQVYP